MRRRKKQKMKVYREYLLFEVKNRKYIIVSNENIRFHCTSGHFDISNTRDNIYFAFCESCAIKHPF